MSMEELIIHALEIGGADGIRSDCPLCQAIERCRVVQVDGAHHQLPPGVDACPTCQGQACERCLMTGRRHLAKLTIAPTTDGRAVIGLWQGPPGTMQPVASTKADTDLSHDTVDALLACLQNGGLIIEDWRPQ